MSLTGPLTSALTGPLTTSLTGTGEITRLFATFDGTDDFISIPAVTAAGDFEWETQLNITGSSGLQTILGHPSTADNFIRIDSITTTPIVRIKLNSVEAGITSTDLGQTKLQTLRVKRTGTTFEVFVDDVSQGTHTDAAWGASFIVGKIGTFGTNIQFFAGVLANVDFISGWTGTATNPTYPLDDAGNTAVNSANPGTGDGAYNNFEVDFSDRELMALQDNGDWLGMELVTNGGFATDTDWTKGSGWTISAGVARHDGVVGSLAQTIDALPGSVYQNITTMVFESGGSLEAQISGATVTVAAGTNTILLTAGGTSLSYGAGSFTGTVDDISTKRILEAP